MFWTISVYFCKECYAVVLGVSRQSARSNDSHLPPIMQVRVFSRLWIIVKID